MASPNAVGLVRVLCALLTSHAVQCISAMGCHVMVHVQHSKA